MTLSHVYYVIRLLRKENERLMKRGAKHMTVDEMRFVISGILWAEGESAFR